MTRFYGSVPSQTVQYALFNGQDGDGVYAIGAATLVGSTWTQYPSNPIIAKASGWESAHVKDPCLLWDGSQYVCYYAGYNGSAYQIGRATAAGHTGPWTKYGSNPVIALGAGGAFDDAGANFPTVLHEPADTGREWKMWYGANDGALQTIGYAYSTNGTSWTKAGMVLTVGAGGTWDDVGVLPMAIYKSGGTYYLFYGGRQGTVAPVKWQGGYATFTDPAGTYTKGAGNPTLLAGFNTSGMSQSLTSNTLSGSTAVNVATTANWAAGMAMVIAAGAVVTEEHTIASLVSTQAVLATAVGSTFNSSDGAVLRPFWQNSVTPRSVLAGDTGFIMYFSAFQPVDDLSVTGETLWEGSLRATASTLGGSWAIDNASGLLFPLSPANTGWNKFSAENPSVIAAP